MILTFVQYGNYENRGKARTRYMQDTLGPEGYRTAFLENLSKVMAEDSLDLNVQEVPIIKEGCGFLEENFRITAQKQDGLYSVLYHPFGGNIPPELIAPINKAVQKMDQVVLRISPDESLYFINCNKDEALELLELTKDSASNLFETSVACIGSGICQVGLRDSQKLYNTIMDKIRPLDFADGVLPRFISPAVRLPAELTRLGHLAFAEPQRLLTKNLFQPSSCISAERKRRGNAQFGEDAGTILEADIPDFLIEIGHAVQEKHNSYSDWIQENRMP